MGLASATPKQALRGKAPPCISVDIAHSGYQQKDRKPSQNDKTEHGMEKTVQNQGQSPKMPKSESILKNQQWWTPTITLIVIHARAEHAVVVSLMEFCLSLYLLKWKSIDFSTRADYSLDSDSLKDSLILQQQNLCVKIVGDPHATIENQSEDFSDSNVESTSTDEIPSLVTIEMLRHPSQIRAR
ncbi:hypothetical protein Tco_0799050 [Tanacetum coccineum]